MSTVELVEAAEKLSSGEFEDFLNRLGVVRARHRAACLSAEEAGLMKRINRGFSESWWQRYRKLIDKREDESLTPRERQELIRLTDTIEKREAARLEALVELARRRRQSLTGLMKELGLIGKNDAQESR